MGCEIRAIVEPDRTISYPSGGYGIFDSRGAPMPNADVRIEVIGKVLGGTSRFYR